MPDNRHMVTCDYVTPETILTGKVFLTVGSSSSSSSSST
jgi:hypothetical protein